jgi:aldehyde dehydrogenase (NAD+)
MGLRIRSGIYS